MKKKKEEITPQPIYVRPLSEAEEAARIARLRTLVDEARGLLLRLKDIEGLIKEKGGSAKIVAQYDVRLSGIYTYGTPEPEPTFFIDANYSAKL